MGILEKYCSHGTGYLLFQSIIEWAKSSNVKRLELSVITENKRAIICIRNVVLKSKAQEIGGTNSKIAVQEQKNWGIKEYESN